MIKYLLDNSSAMQSLDIDAYNQKIANLIIENVDLAQRIEEIEIKITNATNATPLFISKMETVKNNLNTATDKYIEVEKYLINEYSKISFKNARILEEESGGSLIKYALFSLIAGFILGCAVNLIVDRKYLFEDYPEKSKKEPKVSE